MAWDMLRLPGPVGQLVQAGRMRRSYHTHFSLVNGGHRGNLGTGTSPVTPACRSSPGELAGPRHGRCDPTCARRPDVTEFPAGFGHNCGVLSVTPRRMKMRGCRTQMATDYDSPRKTDEEITEDSLQELQARRMDKSSSTIDVDPDDVAESLELPGADLSNEELSFRVIPRQADEFTCSRCFLVHHRSLLSEDRDGQAICRECAA